jgi:NADH:ubiquinone oxidoreductase subunit D
MAKELYPRANCRLHTQGFRKNCGKETALPDTPTYRQVELLFLAINNMGWHLTCEKLLGIQTPKRVDYLRIIIMELARYLRSSDLQFYRWR